jgi:tetratricopeptide (TPR) repeat protein
MPKKNGAGAGLEGLPKPHMELPANGNGAVTGQETAPASAELRDDPQVQACLRELEMSVRLHPEEAVNWYVLGRFLLDIGDHRRAEAMLKQALRRGPESATCRFFLGNTLANNGKFAEAAQHFKCLADVDPELNDPMSYIGVSALSHLGYCLGEMGRWQEAYATLLPATGIAVTIIRDLARFLANTGDYDRSLFLNSVALLLAPGDADLLHRSGSCHMKAGRLQDALDLLRKASKADPEDPDIRYDLGQE